MGEVCDSLVFAFSLFLHFHLHLLWIWSFKLIHMDLNTWAYPWFSPRWPLHLWLTFHSLKNFHKSPRNIFHKRKIFIFFPENHFREVCSKATLRFIAPKTLNKFTNILWTLGHLPEQKYCITFCNIFATENHFCSGQNDHFVQQVYFCLIFWGWSFLSLITLLRDY